MAVLSGCGAHFSKCADLGPPQKNRPRPICAVSLRQQPAQKTDPTRFAQILCSIPDRKNQAVPNNEETSCVMPRNFASQQCQPNSPPVPAPMINSTIAHDPSVSQELTQPEFCQRRKCVTAEMEMWRVFDRYMELRGSSSRVVDQEY